MRAVRPDKERGGPAAAGGPMIEAAGLVRTFGHGRSAVRALDGVDLAIDRGELVVMLGPSGSGKTTLLNIAGAIDAPTEGTISVAGTDVGELDDVGRTTFRREHVGFVFQFFNLIPTLTAAENVELIAGLTGDDACERSREALVQVGLGGRADDFPAALSGGEQQRVAVARAVAKHPELLLGDEPTGSLDLETGRQVLDLLRRLNRERGITMVLVTHNAAIARMADRVVRLRDGRIAGDERNEAPVEPVALAW